MIVFFFGIISLDQVVKSSLRVPLKFEHVKRVAFSLFEEDIVEFVGVLLLITST
jgi:hypothetical protein